MKKKINISVIIPMFNRQSTIYNCLESVVRQTFPPYEIIVVDDSSTDDSCQIVEDLQHNYPIINLIKLNKRSGAQAARNIGIRNANGNYIAFNDSDDQWVIGKLEQQVKYIVNDYNILIHSDCYVDNGKIMYVWHIPSSRSFKDILKRSGPMFQGFLVSKNALAAIGFLDENVVAYQEWDTAIRLSKICNVIHIQKPLFVYNLHSGETISKDLNRGIAGYQYILEKFRKEMDVFLDKKDIDRHYIRIAEMLLSQKDWYKLKDRLKKIKRHYSIKYFIIFISSILKIDLLKLTRKIEIYLRDNIRLEQL